MEVVSSSLRTGGGEEAALRQLMQFAVQSWVELNSFSKRVMDKKEGGRDKYRSWELDFAT